MYSPSPNSKPRPRTFLALLKRNPAMSNQEFSNHWVTEHAQVVLPYFLDAGVESYVQVCEDLLFSRYHLYTSKATPEPAWKAAYYHDIISADELKLLVSKASEHVKL
ncbi:uncharacterized protein Bfra_004002 [Botrytis fragariae]|uniref:EthD domain-containing protein n=1 Tax=Botrytis fragariae TaxID=1964551 RepID=A0A8H6EKH2_9HELO|nr:uncharacterized protein Bfra_004002 [Botrytis fragariae]KAF5875549.1 hypothetical protein Bfra_004002 [Botrytis fragariae]